jgi:hypothetical protein
MSKQDLTDFGMSTEKISQMNSSQTAESNTTSALGWCWGLCRIHLGSKKTGQKSIDYSHILHEQVPPELRL